MLHLLHVCDIISKGTHFSPEGTVNQMKLWYDKRAKDPIYYIQHGVRNGKKVTSKNVKRVGKHSELLKITDDPLAYAQAEADRMNEEYRIGKVQFELKCDFNERVKKTDRESSQSTVVNTGYFILQNIIGQMNLKEFFSQITADR